MSLPGVNEIEKKEEVAQFFPTSSTVLHSQV